jgi:hypothetical protein
MKLGMTGNRNGMSNIAKVKLLDFLNSNKISEVHHGDCLGTDHEFHDICSERNIKIIIHPPNNDKMRAFCKSDNILPEKKFLDRNHDIVNDIDILIAFPPTEKEVIRSGSWATIRYAKKKNKQIFIIFPSGKTEFIK